MTDLSPRQMIQLAVQVLDRNARRFKKLRAKKPERTRAPAKVRAPVKSRRTRKR
jgi:hypothetical protein